MNPDIGALKEALRLIGVTNDEIATAIVDPSPELGEHRSYCVAPYPEWMRDQKAQDVHNLSVLAWERVNLERSKAYRIQAARPDLQDNIDFRRYLLTLRRAEQLAFGLVAFVPVAGMVQKFAELDDGNSYRIGSWPEEGVNGEH